MDELDQAIMEIVYKHRKTNITQIVNDLSRDYNLNILRARVRHHADSLAKFNYIKRNLERVYNSRQKLYSYEVLE